MLKAYQHLTRDQRCQIYALKKRGLTQMVIAMDIGVSQATISRELSRNKGLRGYRFLQAHRFSVQRIIRDMFGQEIMRIIIISLLTPKSKSLQEPIAPLGIFTSGTVIIYLPREE